MKMANVPILAFVALIPWLWLSAAPQDSQDAHVMLVISEAGPRGVARQSEFSKQAKPGAGKELRIWIESGRQCRAVVAAFNRDGRMAYDGLPLETPLKEHSNNQIPLAGGSKWTWDGHENLAEMDVILLSGDSSDTRDLSKLVEAMRDSSIAEAVRKRQSADLRRWIGAHGQNPSSASDYSVKSTPEVMGGMIRGIDCEWCKTAQKIPVPANGIAMVRIHFD